jgi:aspartyl-tRNA(Asn)/glutamyl-tRNA(Gln) amidotransferase subunit C
MSLDEATVARVARLARIEVADDQLAPLAGELSHIMRWIEQLNEVDTAAVEPMTSVARMKLHMRSDEVTDGNRPDDVLGNAPEREDGYFEVPKVGE